MIIQVELCLWFFLLLLLLYYYYSLYSSSISLCRSVGGFLGGGIFSVQLFALLSLSPPPPLMTFLSLLSLPSRLSLSPFVSALLCKLSPPSLIPVFTVVRPETGIHPRPKLQRSILKRAPKKQSGQGNPKQLLASAPRKKTYPGYASHLPFFPIFLTFLRAFTSKVAFFFGHWHS